MLNSKFFSTFLSKLIIPLIGCQILVSCMPTATTSQVNTSNNTNTGTTTTTTYSDPTFPLTGIFLQEGTTQTKTGLTLPYSFSDSFLIRGTGISQYLRTVPLATKFCLVAKYNYISGSDRFMVLAAKAKTFTDVVNKTTEYYLYVEPSNDASNQNDCLVYNLTNSLFTNAAAPTISFSFTQLCSNCSNAVTSSALKLYFINGQEVPTISLGTPTLTISGSTSSSTGSCSESTACAATGFDCCLQGQCVTDAALRPGASLLAGFSAAQEDVRLNPNRFIVYPQYYFVCPTRPTGTTTGGTGGGTTEDPEYAAATRLMELNHLYECLNKVDGEFSYCTVKITGASKNIPGNFASSNTDDVNFSTLNPSLGTGDYVHNIVKINYGGSILYQLNSIPLSSGAAFVSSTNNDNLTTTEAVKITASLPQNAVDDNLYLTYKIDGTCEKVGSALAKCTKTYVQASTDIYSTTWHDSGNVFTLPAYGDFSSSASVIVKIGGVIVPEDTNTWSRASSPNRVIFSSAYNIYQNQTVEISYYVTSGVSNLFQMKGAAQTQVNTMCACLTTGTCNLKPVISTTTSAIVDYECVLATASTTPAANQTVYVSNKNVPHRYYDLNGVSYDDGYASAPIQELAAFTYTNSNVLKPNNMTYAVGFNEIYGSFDKTGTYIAKPAKLVKVKRDINYDIFVDSGSFSTCTTCGNDYYNTLQKIFPQNFAGVGGGYSPNKYESSRQNNTSIYRSDDLLFGRACFVPATMLPWTHYTSSSATVKDQRQTRLTGQHFMFANGYQRDWFGFDYGSLIGSFDGVKWFSIGNQRRIKSTSTKLFLAINANFGDLSVDNSYTVTVSETAASTLILPDHDTKTDGAECQQSHYCSTDNDCVRQLGYDYSCQNVSALTTNWPEFDANASEILGSTPKTITSLIGGLNGQAKRCVYRGRGAPCVATLPASSATFNGLTTLGTLSCSPNNSCAPLGSGKFNDRIARFATTPLAQNLGSASATNSDIVGLGARIIGRPFDYYGSKAIPNGALIGLSSNLVGSICIPGKDLANSSTVYELNSRLPGVRTDSSDKLFGTGATLSTTTTSAKYYNACPATDASGTYIHHYSLPITDSTLTQLSVTQNISSNLLDISPLVNLNIFSSTNGSVISDIGYQRNTCLRAPGASCFTDMECAPSALIASKVKSTSIDSTILNSAEKKFWEEELICGNPDFKYVASGLLSSTYDIKKNNCCRETGKTISVFTQSATSDFKWCQSSNIKVAGVNTTPTDPSRYSRVHSAYDQMSCTVGDSKPFALSVEATNSTNRLTQVLGQYKTLDAVNQRTCCTANWVRSFAPENGGGHRFSRSKLQTVDKEMFKHISWNGQNTSIITDLPFECNADNYANSSCEVKSLSQSEQDLYLGWAASLELVGIPQVVVKTNDEIYKNVNDSQIAYGAGVKVPLNHSIVDIATTTEDFRDSSNIRYYSAASYTKFDISSSGLKKVFSESEFNCCIPSNKEVPSTTTAEQCCTGNLANTNGPLRCCLPDFTDVTVYLNRYISSEGRGLGESAYDQTTGYIKDPALVKSLVASKNLCCSGTAMTGVAISRMSIPLENGAYKPADQLSTSMRFNYRTDAVDNNTETGSIGSIFDAGVRWNNHVYCVPAGFNQ